MSLIIHTIVPEGIVVCADTRTTHRDGKGHVRYDDTAEKIVPFPNRIVVSHCGDAKVRENLTVMQFLYDIRKKYGKQTTIDNLPLKILNEYFRVNGNGCTIFKISGYFEFGRTACTYTIDTAKSSIVLSTEMGSYGASYNGITDVAHAIMNSGIDYKNLSLTNAISLTRGCLLENINVFQYHAEQSIGGACQTYIIDVMHDSVGWYQDDGEVKPDTDAPSDALWKLQNKGRESPRFQPWDDRPTIMVFFVFANIIVM